MLEGLIRCIVSVLNFLPLEITSFNMKIKHTFHLPLLMIMLSTSFSWSQPLSGNYTIDNLLPTSGTNFQSFNDFATRLATDGVSGDVVADVNPSIVYFEQVTFHTIPGAGPTATVTIEGHLATIEAVTTTTDRHVIRLEDVSWMTIRGMSILYDPTSTGGFYGIQIYNSGSHLSILNNSIYMNSTSTLHGGIVASGSTTSILDPGNFDNILIAENSITSGGYGISVYGDAASLATQIEIANNYIADFADNGIYIRETDGVHITGNLLEKIANIISSANAIQIAQNANINAVIENNKFHILQQNNGTQTLRGIYLFNGSGHRVFNNEISASALTTGNFTGIEIRTSATAPEISFNVISGEDAAAATGNFVGISEELSNTNSVLKNNLISITKPGTGTRAALKLGTTSTVTTALQSNYNDFWVPSGNVAVKGTTNPTAYPTLTDWQSASSQDANSISIEPFFTSPTFLLPTNPALNNQGTPIAWVTMDIDGNPRDPGTPDIGAYEYFVSGIHNSPIPLQATIAPNPSNGKIWISISEFAAGEIICTLYDYTGKKQLKQSVNGARSFGFDLDNVAAGVYLLQISNQESSKAFRVIKTD